MPLSTEQKIQNRLENGKEDLNDALELALTQDPPVTDEEIIRQIAEYFGSAEYYYAEAYELKHNRNAQKQTTEDYINQLTNDDGTLNLEKVKTAHSLLIRYDDVI